VSDARTRPSTATTILRRKRELRTIGIIVIGYPADERP
jgi:hypothetical protein